MVFNNELEVVICLHESHLKNFKLVISQLYKNLKNIKIIVISNIKLKEKIKNIDSRIEVLDEDTLVKGLSLCRVKDILKEKIGNESRAGWYFQQFLKMSYSLVTKSDYYLIWDSDLIILKELDFFTKDNKMIIYKKTEYHTPYFETMKKILNLDKTFDFSFIAEHLLIKTKIMKEIIDKIQSKNEIKGNYYFEKILNSISLNNLPKSGFSEFETYGTYALINYKELFVTEDIRSWRNASEYLKDIELSSAILEIISKEYDNLSLESWSKGKRARKIFINDYFLKKLGINLCIKLVKIFR